MKSATFLSENDIDPSDLVIDAKYDDVLLSIFDILNNGKTLDNGKILDKEIVVDLLEKANHLKALEFAFDLLSRATGELTKENCNRFIECAEYAESLALSFGVLFKNKILDKKDHDKTNRAILFENAPHALSLARALVILHDKEVEKINNPNISEFFLNRDILVKYAQHAEIIAGGFSILHDEGMLQDQNIRKVLMENVPLARWIADAFRILHSGDILQNNPDIYQLLIENVQHAQSLVAAFDISLGTNIWNPLNITLIIKHPQYALSLTEAFKILQDADLLENNRDILISNPQHAEIIAKACVILDGAKILKENYDILINNSQHADALAKAFSVLYGAEMLKENRDKLIKNAQYAESLAEGFAILQEAGILNQQSISLLIDNAQDQDAHHFAMRILEDTKILSKPLISFIIDNAESGAKLLIPEDSSNSKLGQMDLVPEYSLNSELGQMDLVPESSLNSEIGQMNLVPGYLLNSKLGQMEKEKLAKLETVTDFYRYIYSSLNTIQFSENIKIAAFFIVHHNEMLKKGKTSELNEALSNLQPASLRKKLQKILNKLGGYNAIPNSQEPMEIKDLTIGVEIEYSGINNKYKKLTEFIMKLIQPEWKHPGDGSVNRIGSDTYGGEATTPRISDNDELTRAMLNVAFLQAMGGETNSSCGLHVHIGVENIETPQKYGLVNEEFYVTPKRNCTNYQLEFMKQFLLIYKREEPKFAPIEREPNRYCQSVTLPKDIKDIQKINTFEELKNSINPDGRYYEINLHAFIKHGTIEVRRFSGTAEEAQVYATVAMIAAIAKEARMQTNQIFDDKLQQKIGANITTPLVNTEDDVSLSKAMLSFFNQQPTAQKTELFNLRINPVQESQLVITVGKVDKANMSKNTIYANLEDEKITYIFCDKQGKVTEEAIIEGAEFREIIDKLKDNQKLDVKDKNKLLLELSSRGHANISHRVEKVQSDTAFSEMVAKRSPSFKK